MPGARQRTFAVVDRLRIRAGAAAAVLFLAWRIAAAASDEWSRLQLPSFQPARLARALRVETDARMRQTLREDYEIYAFFRDRVTPDGCVIVYADRAPDALRTRAQRVGYRLSALLFPTTVFPCFAPEMLVARLAGEPGRPAFVLNLTPARSLPPAVATAMTILPGPLAVGVLRDRR